MIEYKNLIYNEEAILNLYLDNEWYAYTNDKESLFEGIKNSVDVIGAYQDDELIGLIRTIGDQKTIIYIQDTLILKEHHREGIGRQLIKMIVDKYPTVRQIVLATDNTEKTRGFYESIGFVSYDKVDCIGFTYKR